MARKKRRRRRASARRSRELPLIATLTAVAAVFVIFAGIRAGRRSAAGKSAAGYAGAVSVREDGLASREESRENPASVSVSAESAAGAVTATPVESAAEAVRWDTPLDRYYLDKNFWKGCPERNVQLLTPNEYSRPQTDIDEVNDIVVHYVDEPGSTAMQNRDYFESLKDGSGRSVSSHFVIGLDGEIVQCVPLGEVAYASNHRNHDTLSIECCHPDDTGEFTEETYRSVVDLCAWLCLVFQISPDHVIRHYDVTEKECPIYYVKHPDEWEAMKKAIAKRYDRYVEELGTP